MECSKHDIRVAKTIYNSKWRHSIRPYKYLSVSNQNKCSPIKIAKPSSLRPTSELKKTPQTNKGTIIILFKRWKREYWTWMNDEDNRCKDPTLYQQTNSAWRCASLFSRLEIDRRFAFKALPKQTLLNVREFAIQRDLKLIFISSSLFLPSLPFVLVHQLNSMKC